MIAALNDRCFDPKLSKVFRHFKTDKSTADHDRCFRLILLYKCADLQRILYCSERERSFIFRIEIGQKGLCAGG